MYPPMMWQSRSFGYESCLLEDFFGLFGVVFLLSYLAEWVWPTSFDTVVSSSSIAYCAF